jgi:error-prone DNA polymerase
MGWGNPPIPWSELERRLSDRARTGDGGDSPAWSRKRRRYSPADAPPIPPPASPVPYAELHCHSNFSFLDGASHPEELAEEAVRLGLEAVALTDHDGMYGVVRFAAAAAAYGLSTVYGAELSVGLTRPQNGVEDPEGEHLLLLARDLEGYRRLCRSISAAQLAGEEKGRPVYDLDALAADSGGPNGHWMVLTGCRKGAVPAALDRDGPAVAARALDRLRALFGRDAVAVELWDHDNPLDSARNDSLAALAVSAGVPLVATNNVHYATPGRRRLATALAAVRARGSLDDLEGWLPPAASAHLRSGAEMARRFDRFPGVLENTVALARECTFDLKLVAPRLPDYPVPEGHTEMSWLRQLTEEGARRRYGRRGDPATAKAYSQIDHELAMIEQLGFPGYFLIVWDIVEFCRRANVFCQGRGSAANSAVCYALGITNVDAVHFGLLFERFLSPARDGPPDIDLDIESDRREEAIQYVYSRYGRDRAAQVANVITYRPRSAARDMAKALGFGQGQQDAWSKQIEGYGPLSEAVDTDLPASVVELAEQVGNFPRHLGIHSGGMVICDRPVVEVCPVEWARMPGRTVLQWDKDDCAEVGLVKFDLLGLGMLSALHYALDLIADYHGDRYELATIPKEEPTVYDMLCAADAIGVFQVESRAQLATLPRLKPRTFYDLVVEVALIRPGPIQGNSVHPYIRRRNGTEEISYLHPLLEPALEKTYGVPLFQEQLMQIAIDAAGFSPAESDQLRQAMSSKRSAERMLRLRPRLLSGMAASGIDPESADRIYDKLVAFANFGFPESHAISFAYLVYASSWIKLHYPAAFCAALLRAQPMGFYSPQSLVADARRHGVTVHGPDINASTAEAGLEPGPDGAEQPAIRLGLSSVRHLGDDMAELIAAGRPYDSMEDLVRRTGVSTPAMEALATAGAFGCFGRDRRAALWAAGAVAQVRPVHLPGIVTGGQAPRLSQMDIREIAAADVWATGVSTDSFPTQFVRDRLDAFGVLPAKLLRTAEDGSRVLAAGVVTHRQRPSTAGGTTFLNLEDETGHVNVICSQGLWARHRRLARESAALVVRGRVERAEGVTNLIADQLRPLHLSVTTTSRDFR